ncbi:MAG: carbohydrate ABC transporter permease [Clostridia bacterium]|nr:carbohydrate ABC transporter permease [Clostridia bacterium]
MMNITNRKNTPVKKQKLLISQSVGDITFDIINHTLLVLLLIIFLYPLIYVISCSFSSAMSIWSGEVFLFPKNFTLEGYRLTFENQDIWIGYANSLLYALVGTVISVSLNLITAYPLSRIDFMPRNGIMLLYVFCMYFSGGLIPTYLVVKNLGFIDKIWALVIPGAVSTWNVILIRTYFMSTIPRELYEAASIDGCSNTWFFLQCVLPLSKPIIAVIVLFTAVGFWNSYFSAMLYLTTRSKFPLQLILREILIVLKSATSSQMIDVSQAADLMESMEKSATMRYSCIVVASVPVIVIYPLIQKYFVKGVMVGALKT